MFVSLAHLVVKILVFVRGWGIVGVIIGGVIGRSGRSRVINCAEGGGCYGWVRASEPSGGGMKLTGELVVDIDIGYGQSA